MFPRRLFTDTYWIPDHVKAWGIVNIQIKYLFLNHNLMEKKDNTPKMHKNYVIPMVMYIIKNISNKYSSLYECGTE